jgi:hypothetical protein
MAGGGRISPAIFGALFQSVMKKELRRNPGAHYTTEKNILKLIGPLFLDELRAEFEKLKGQKKKLAEFHQRLGQRWMHSTALRSLRAERTMDPRVFARTTIPIITVHLFLLSCRPACGPLCECRRSLSRPCGKGIGNERV